MRIKTYWIFLLISLFLVGCDSQLKVHSTLSNDQSQNQDVIASLKIAQSEVVGSCTFNSSSQFVNSTNFSYLLTFSKEINSAVVSAQTIPNSGTGGATDLNWAIQDCGDRKNFKIEPTLIVGDGTIIPDVSNIITAVSSPDKIVKLENNINQITVNYDTQAPLVTINQSSSESVGSCSFTGTNDPTNVAGFSYKIAFSEKINPATFIVSDITNTGTGGGSSLVWVLENCGDDQNFKLIVNSLTGDGTVIPAISAGVLTDIAGNTNTISSSVDNSISYDTSSLLVNINQSMTEVIGTCSFTAATDPSNVAGFSYKVVFSKNIDVSSFATSDVTNSGTSGDIGWSLGSCGDGKTFKLVADTIEFNGTVIPTLANGVVLDSVGNGNQASSGVDNSITFDNVRPSVTINQATTETVGSCSFNTTTDPTHILGFNYKIVFSENINTSSFATGDITNNGTSGLVVWNLESCGDSKVFKLTASSVALDGTVIPVISVNSVGDLAGNLNTLSTSTDNSVTYDAIAPSVTINQSVVETVGSCSFVATNDPTNVAGFSYKIHFLEAIDPASFAISDVSNIGTGGATTLTWQLENCGDDQNFKLTANSVAGEGTIIPRIGANQVYDVAGNLNTLSTATDNSVTFDTTSPSVTINQSIAETVGSCSFLATSDPTNAAGFAYKVAFSEAVNAASFTVADIVNSGTGGGTTLTWALASCGDNQNFKLTANAVSGDGTIIPVVSAGGVSDVAGNLNTLSTATDNSITYDTTVPDITISRSVVETVGSCSFTGTNATEGAPGFNFKVVFSEKINNSSFTVADVTNSGTGGATTLTWSLTSCGDDQNYRLTVSAITGEGTVIPQILASRVTDVAGNQNTLSSSSNGTVTYELLGWRQEAYIKAVNSEAIIRFGVSVSISGDTLAVGANFENSNATTITNGTGYSNRTGTLSFSGAVYVYKRTGNNWVQEAYIKAVNTGSDDRFGSSISLKGDTLAVGALTEDSNATIITNGASFSGVDSASNSGAVYVYKRTGSNWAQEAYIKAVNNGASDNFGYSVSISGDTIAVGTPYEDSDATTITNGTGFSGVDTGATENGAVYVYKRTGNSWAQEAYIKAVNNGASDYFGISVSLSGDTLAVGAYGEDSNATTITNGTSFSEPGTSADSGAVYVYKRTGSNWAQEAYVKAVNNEASDSFGTSVSISGNTLAVGAIYEDSNATTITNGAGFSDLGISNNSGAVYVYKRSGNIWAQEAYVKAVNSGANDQFGISISLSGDTLAVGARYEDSNATTITDGAGFSEPGTSTDSGAVYVYKRTGNNWAQESYIKAVNNGANDYFGFSVSLSGDSLAVGSYYEDSNATTITNGAGVSGVDSAASDSGAVYVYRNNARLFNTQDAFTTNVSTTSLTLNWINSGYKTTGYFIAYAQGFNAPVDCNSGTVVDVGNNTSYTFNSLSAGTYYSFRICSYDTNANLSSGYVISFPTASLLPEPGDLNSNPGNYPDREVTLTWASAGGSVTGYRLVYQQGSTVPLTCNSGTIIDIGNVLTYQFTALLTNTDYGVRVCSYDGSGNLSLGKYISIKTTLALNPIDGYITSTAITNDRLTFLWTNASDRVTGFIVAWAAGATPPATCSAGTVVDVGNVTSYLINGLTAGASYAVRICAYEAGGTNTSAGVTLVGNVRNDGWVQEAYIKAVNNEAGDYFGISVSLSGDTLAVGAYGEDSNATTITNGASFSGSDASSLSDIGAVYIYKRVGNNWAQEAYIKAVNSGMYDSFGISVSISGDTLVVGASQEDSSATTITNGTSFSEPGTSNNSGAVYVYKRTGSNWAQEAYVKAVNSRANDTFGSSVSISGDTLAVGAYSEDSNATTITNGNSYSGTYSGPVDSGAVYVYKRTGNIWAQEAYIKAVNNGASDYFGSSVSISGDTLAVGVYGEDSNATTITNGTGFSDPGTSTDSGAVYVYKRTRNNWAQEAYVKAVNSGINDQFGYSVSISGNTLAVGARLEDSNATTITNGANFSEPGASADSGAVYVYKRTGNIWAQEAYIKAVNNGASDYFGNNLSLSGDTLAVGARLEDSNATTITNGTGFSDSGSITNSGAVYVYKRTGNNWAQEAYVKAVNNELNDYFGSNISLSGDTLAVGASYEDSNATTITNGASFSGTDSSVNSNNGAVYIYRNNARIFNTQDAFTSNVSTTSLTLNWIKSGYKTTGYFIAYAQGFNAPVDCNSGTVVNVGNNTSYTFNSLSAGTHYSFRICSYDTNANLSSGYVISFPTASLLPEPGDLSAVTNSDRAVTINWASAGGSATGYRLVYQQGSSAPLTCNNGTIIDVGNVLTYQVTGLLTNTDYGVRVCSYDGSGNLSLGKYISIKTTLALNPIDVYTTSTAVTNDRLTVGWTNASDRVTGFIVAWAAGATAPATCSAGTVVDVGNVTSYLINGLTAGASYAIRICAYEAGGTNTSAGVTLVGNVRNNGWVQEAYIKASNNGANDNFGYSVSISGDTLAVGAYVEDSNATTITNGAGFSGTDVGADGSGAVYVYKRTGNSWAQEAYVKAVNNGTSDYFGISVSISGDTLAVGARGEDSNAITITNGAGFSGVDSGASDSGAVYVYKRTGSNWAQEAYIKAVNSGVGDFFGTSVSISGDTLAVGAIYEDSNATTITNGAGFSEPGTSTDSGAVYVYKRTGSLWAQEAYVKAANSGANDNFGVNVSISGDTLAVGANYEDSNATTITNGTSFSGVDSGAANESGAVYVYKRTGNNWAQEAYIKSVNSGAGDNFGTRVSVNGDTLAVGAIYEDSNATTITNGTSFSEPGTSTDSGAVYVYKRTGSNWAQEAYVKAVNNGANDYFGYSVSISGDTLAVGARLEDSNATTITNGTGFSDSGSITNSGAVYVYKRTGNNWAQEAYVKAVNNELNDYFGSNISLSGDTLAVGVQAEDSNLTTITSGTGFSEPGVSTDSGAVYIYRNNARLFTVTEIFPVITSNSISFKWNKTGGTALGYGVNFELGIVTPPLCSLSMDYNLGNNNELLLESLTADTDYSFRFCVYDNSNQFVEDKVIYLRTNP